MALSQKHPGKIVVPWFNSAEWKYVYLLIYAEGSTKFDKLKAFGILEIWKARMPIVFAGVEGTLIILKAMLYDENTYSKEDLSRFYGLAIMRFLNLCAANSDQQGTFSRIAKEKNLPDWLVHIRHNIAHSHELPSFFMLKYSIKYCFEWLKREYWEVQNREIKDLIPTPTYYENIDELKIYFGLVVAIIKEDELPPHIINMLKDINHVSPKKVDLAIILNQLINNKKLSKDITEKIVDLLVENYLFETPFENSQKISKACIGCWNPFIQCLHDNNVLVALIKKLNSICYWDRENDSYLSCLWLKKIFTSLLLEIKPESHIVLKNAKEDDCCVLNLHGTNQQFLEELKMFANDVINAPHTYLRHYLTELMTLCSYNKAYIKHVNDIINIWTTDLLDDKKSTIIDEPAKTLDDVNNVIKTNIFEKLGTTLKVVEPKVNKLRWKKVENVYIYKGCPIGVLPSQSRKYNPTINFKY